MPKGFAGERPHGKKSLNLKKKKKSFCFQKISVLDVKSLGMIKKKNFSDPICVSLYPEFLFSDTFFFPSMI